MQSIPRLEHLPDGIFNLIVDDKPFLMRAGELQNSSMSSATFMSKVWPNLRRMGLNTVLGSVSWEQIEPVEGSFDWEELDRIIRDAQSNQLRLVLLWFGSFKNGMSTYTPPWVKTNPKRFPRAKYTTVDGIVKEQDTLSPFAVSSMQADAKAFAALMAHIKAVDTACTVIMVQVENECGLLGGSRDVSDLGNCAFAETVPDELVDMFSREMQALHPRVQRNLAGFTGHKGNSWTATFGPGSKVDEIFMAYAYTKYVDHVAAAGKAQYPLPLFTNAWLANDDQDDSNAQAAGGSAPGVYPSGGPVPDVIDIWQLFAPNLDFVAPDIYLMDYESACRSYSSRRQALFIPEQRRDEQGAIRIWAAIGTHNALGASPFGIDSISASESVFTTHYELLGQVAPYILAARMSGRRTYGFFFDAFRPGTEDPSPERLVEMAGWALVISRAAVFGHPKAGFGIVIHLEGSRFMLIGEGYQVAFKPLDPAAVHWSLLSFREQVLDDEGGEMRDGRWMNGDESVSRQRTTVARMPSTDPDSGDYCISTRICAGTGIAKVEPYFTTE